MLKTFFLVLTTFFLVSFLSVPVNAAGNNFVSIVNPVRGEEFWDLKEQKPIDGIKGQIEILKTQNLPATFLLRFDALQDNSLTQLLIPTNFEKGLFLEITPKLANSAGVDYHQSSSWHNAASVLITGYSPSDRLKLIDTDFAEFKKIFGSYPKSVGAWWIDASSLAYMQQKYEVETAMVVADQYSTDSYQIWGQYWSTPYYPAKNNALFPAQTKDNKINVVITQWAARDPVGGYGTGVEDSTLSVQANDYIDYHDLKTDYFAKLIDIYTTQKLNQFGQVIVGLENSYSWNKYKEEYQNQINSLVSKKNTGQLKIITLSDFAKWYKTQFPNLSPEQTIIADDPLGSSKKAVWFMNNFYRAGWVYNNEGSVVRDLRQYVSGQDEICLNKACNEVNFATFATRVLDEVTYGQKLVIDEGRISDFSVVKNREKIVLNYKNEAGKGRSLGFLPRDIEVNGKVSSIDGAILDATINNLNSQKQTIFFENLDLQTSFWSEVKNFVLFIFSFIFLIIIPGFVITKKISHFFSALNQAFLLTISGIVALTLVGFLSQLIFKNYYLVYGWVVLSLILSIYLKLYKFKLNLELKKQNFPIYLIVLAGTIFLTISTFRNGLTHDYGVGFWGPNGHDGVWHLALINSLSKSVPPENPILSGQILQNYHYFFDLLLAIFAAIAKIPAVDLLFRFFPLVFGLLLGIGTICLVSKLYQGKNLFLAKILSLYLVYFCGSFGWISDFIKNKSFNGESDFWANQAVSFNLNPPFAFSLLQIIALVILLPVFIQKKSLVTALLILLISGSLLEFKAYGAILFGLSLLIFALLRKSLSLLALLVGTTILSLLTILPNYPSLISIFLAGSSTFVFSPFWFIHSMIDSPDRLGLTRISLMRVAGWEEKNWLKFLTAEIIGIFLFIIGNLGIRVFVFINIFRIKNIFPQVEYQLIWILSLVALMIPLLFIQTGTPWNTIQFFYYFLFFGSLMAGIEITKLSNKLPNFFKFIFIALIVAIAPINSIAVAQGYFYKLPHTFISQEEITGLAFLSNQPNGVVLTHPFDKNLKKNINDPLPILAYDTTAYVSAFSAKTTFVEDEVQQGILSTNYKGRIIEARDFFLGKSPKDSIEFLKVNNIKYIYLPKIYKINLTSDQLQLTQIFSNNEVVIYQYNNETNFK